MQEFHHENTQFSTINQYLNQPKQSIKQNFSQKQQQPIIYWTVDYIDKEFQINVTIKTNILLMKHELNQQQNSKTLISSRIKQKQIEYTIFNKSEPKDNNSENMEIIDQEMQIASEIIQNLQGPQQKQNENQNVQQIIVSQQKNEINNGIDEQIEILPATIDQKINYRITEKSKNKKINITSKVMDLSIIGKSKQLKSSQNEKQTKNDLISEKFLIQEKLKQIKQSRSRVNDTKSLRNYDKQQEIYEYYLKINEFKLKNPEIINQLNSLKNPLQKHLLLIDNDSVVKQQSQCPPINQNKQISQTIRVKLNKMVFPKLPDVSFDKKSKQLFQIAKIIFQIFRVCKFDQKVHISIEKYRNCLHFIAKNIHILWYNNGRFYIGQYKLIAEHEGHKHGYGIQLLPQKSVYQGEFKNNKRQGYGKLKFQNGDLYQGYFLEGLQDGKGKLYENNTLIYEGDWKKGNMNGKGKLLLHNGDLYQGQVINGIQNGSGILYFKNGDLYKGDFIEGKFNGLGVYSWSHGEVYQGQFFNGCRHGTGIWKSKVVNGLYDQYHGQYRNNKKSGMGKYIWPDGKSFYQGQFQNDQRHGVGIINQNGKSIKALWENGLIRKILSEDVKQNYQTLSINNYKSQQKNVRSKSQKTSLDYYTHKFERSKGRINTKSDKQTTIRILNTSQNKSGVIYKTKIQYKSQFQPRKMLYISKTGFLKQNSKQQMQRSKNIINIQD